MFPWFWGEIPGSLGQEVVMPGDPPSLEPVPLQLNDLVQVESEDPGGPAFVVSRAGSPPEFFFVYGDFLLLGRAEDVHLPINLKSISRHHARISVGSEGVVLEDLMSENGTYVNGVRIERRVLCHSDEVTLGTFTMTYLGDQESGQVYDGVPIRSLGRYGRLMKGFDHEATFRIPSGLIARRNEVSRLLHHGVLRTTEGGQSWTVGTGKLQFGKEADVPCSELLVKGVLAELSWTGRRHEVRRAARRATVRVNGAKVAQQELEPGDQLQVGRARFTYVIDA